MAIPWHRSRRSISLRWRILVAALLAVTGIPRRTALANGRAPNTSTINFRRGSGQDIAAGLTFGVVLSHDGGATWHWMCEKAVLYGGMYDPDYVYTAAGPILATTFDGALVNRDGCVFTPTSFGKKFFASITQASDGTIYMAAADVPDGMGSVGDAKIYKSTDNGMTFPTSATAGQINDWYNSIEVAPSDPNRVYVSAYRLGTGGTRTFQIYKSTDAGATFTPVNSTAFTTSDNTTIDIVGIKATAPDTLFVRVSLPNGILGDAIWRSDDAGATWTKIFEKQDNISFVARANGDLVAATRLLGTSVARGPTNATWESTPNAPHINCLVESPGGVLWACTQNYGVMQIPTDDAGIMKTTDLTAWTKVLRYQEISGPVDCAAGTRQHDQCVYDCLDMVYNDNPANCPNSTPRAWCILKNQLGITSTVIDCPAAVADAAPDAITVNPKNSGGCCDAGDTSTGAGASILGIGIVLLVWRPRRR